MSPVGTALAILGLLFLSIVTAGLIAMALGRLAISASHGHIVKTEPKQIDDTPIMQCQECGGTWLDMTDPIHEGHCPVAFIKNEARRFRPILPGEE